MARGERKKGGDIVDCGSVVWWKRRDVDLVRIGRGGEREILFYFIFGKFAKKTF